MVPSRIDRLPRRSPVLAGLAMTVGATGLLALSGCSGTSVEEAEDAPSPGTTNVVRTVTWQEWPVVHERCLTEAGFPPSGRSQDGSLEYGPYDQTQTVDYERADAACRAMYPMKSDYATASHEDWIALYEHQRDTWSPCMSRAFGIDVGELPSVETFIAEPAWIDVQHFSSQVEAAVEDGRLSDMNAWWVECPDFIAFE